MRRLSLLLALSSCLLPAAVTKVYVVDRADVLDGREFGAAGAYERIIARAFFAVDPSLLQNKAIRDLELAPRNAAGLVEFSADVFVIRPRDPSRGNGTLLLEIPNRGGKGMLNRFQYAQSSLDPKTPQEFGDNSLLEQGFTLAWVGWQWDVPEKPGLLRMQAPIATNNGQVITGPVRSEYIPRRAEKLMPLGDRDHTPFTPYAPAMSGARLTVRTSPDAKAKSIPSSAWQWSADRKSIEAVGGELANGFEPGLLYEFVYTAENPRVTGLGMVAVRDFVSYLRYEGSGVYLLGDMRRATKRAMSFGISQSGRFLRTFLYTGMNEDEKGRKVFEGVWADVAGAGRGSFNHRFAQASRDGYPWFNVDYPTDVFPFTDADETDPLTGAKDGLLSHLKPEMRPKIVYTNNSTEYWGRIASLIHLSPDAASTIPPLPDTRIYFLAGAQHGPGRMPPGKTLQYPANPVDQRPVQRAVLAALHAWVKDGTEPPVSRFPRMELGELVAPKDVRFPKTVAATVPKNLRRALPLDFGPDFYTKGIISTEPPKFGRAFPALVPQVDDNGVDLGGIRLPMVEVPLGAFTGWNVRPASQGAPGEMSSLEGSFFAFPKQQILARFPDKNAYMNRAAISADSLIQQRFLLPQDRARVLDSAAALWDYVFAQP